MDREAERSARQKIAYWQKKQRELISDTGLRRDYTREAVRTGKAALADNKGFTPLKKEVVF